MKTYFKPFIILLLSSTVCFTACEEEESVDENPDPRTLLVGDYKIGNFQVHVYDGGSVNEYDTVTTKPVIKLKVAKNLNKDELRIDLREFIEETMTEIFPPSQTGASLTIDIHDPDEMIAELITGRAYEIKDIDFDLIFSDGIQSAAYPSDFSAEGKFDKGELTLEFVMQIQTGILTTFEGTAIGKKE